MLRSGLILYSSRIISVLTGFAFTIMITRNVPVEEYGVWTNINIDIIPYFTLVAMVLPFWVMRFVAREHEGSARTGVAANLFLGGISTLIYILLVPFILPLLGIDMSYLPIYLLASVQIIEVYLSAVFQSILRVVKIEALGYGLLLEEAVKVSLAYLLIIRLKTGLQGGMLALICALLSQVLFYIYMARKDLGGSINWSHVKEWVKGSLANLYNIIGQRIAAFSLILLITICSGIIGLKARAYYGASFQIAAVINHSSFLVFALYPRLLILRRNSDDIVESFKLFFMFALPMTVGIIVFADSFLTLLGEGRIAEGYIINYSAATSVLRLLAPSMLILSISQVLDAIVFGTEKFDLEAKIRLRELVKSKIFIIFSLQYVKALITLPALYFVLPLFSEDPISAALYTALLMLLANSLLLLVRCILVRKTLTFPFPWKNVLKYLFSSGLMAVFLLLIEHPTRISTTALYTLLGGIIYFSVLLVIDESTRTLIRAIWNEIKSILGLGGKKTV